MFRIVCSVIIGHHHLDWTLLFKLLIFSFHWQAYFVVVIAFLRLKDDLCLKKLPIFSSFFISILYKFIISVWILLFHIKIYSHSLKVKIFLFEKKDKQNKTSTIIITVFFGVSHHFYQLKRCTLSSSIIRTPKFS